MEKNRAYTIEEIKDLIIRVQVLYSFLSPASKRKVKKACRDNAMKKFIAIEDLQKYIDPLTFNSTWVLFIVPEKGKETVTVDSFPTLLKNCSYLITKELVVN